MKPNRRAIGDLGLITERYLNVPALVIGFIADMIALVAVFGVTGGGATAVFALGGVMQITIWGAAVITYLGILRRYWAERRDKINRWVSPTFDQFIERDLVKFNHPFLLIPLVFLLGTYINILVNYFWETISITVPIFLFVTAFILQKRNEQQSIAVQNEQKRLDDAEWVLVRQSAADWMRRIHNYIAEQGYVTDYELSSRYRVKLSVCQKAMQLYERRYLERIKFIHKKERVTAPFGYRKKSISLYDFSYYATLFPIEVWVLAKKDVAEHVPWLQDAGRFFDMNVIN